MAIFNTVPPLNAGAGIKFDGKTISTAAAPRNLLDNSDFRNPVNQRGQTSYTGNGYSIDRWKSGSSNSALTVNDGYITITGSNYVQYIPGHKDGTFSAFAKNISGGLVQLDTGYDASLSARYVNIPFGSWAWAALYEGEYTAETLPDYQPKGYGAELLECQRYYYRINGITDVHFAFAAGLRIGNETQTVSNIPTNMRIKNVAMSYNNVSGLVGGSTGVPTLTAAYASGDAVFIKGTVNYGNNSDPSILRLEKNTNAYIAFSADL